MSCFCCWSSCVVSQPALVTQSCLCHRCKNTRIAHNAQRQREYNYKLHRPAACMAMVADCAKQCVSPGISIDGHVQRWQAAVGPSTGLPGPCPTAHCCSYITPMCCSSSRLRGKKCQLCCVFSYNCHDFFHACCGICSTRAALDTINSGVVRHASVCNMSSLQASLSRSYIQP